MNVIVPTNLVCALFSTAIPTSSFNFIESFFILVFYEMKGQTKYEESWAGELLLLHQDNK